MASIQEKIREKPWLGWLLFFATAVIVFFLGLLASSIIERRSETQYVYKPKVELSQYEPRNEVWGENYPLEYESWKKTADTSYLSKYNGSAMRDMLAEDPRMVVLWAGYGFSKDYTQARGHAYAIEDMRVSLRTGAPVGGTPSPMPNTCWTCKSPDVPRVMKDIGIAQFYSGTWEGLGAEVVNPIGCADCHDSETMNLKISRPALVEAFERQGKNIEEASHQDMRSLVCAQCHVEYYFDKTKVEGSPYLTFPWDNGMSVEQIEEYYDARDFSDWTHKISKTPMLKAQHPGYEIYSKGIHAQRGVACADCHMPYISEGGQKFTSHHIVSPLSRIDVTCQVCHRDNAEELIKTTYMKQDAIFENRTRLEKMLVRAHVEAGKAWELGATEEQMKDILMDIRHAQWRWDYAVASHGASFHATVEVGRILGTALDIAQDARVKLARLLASLGHNMEVPYPEIATKAAAQKFIGLDMEKLHAEKQEFINKVLPVWDAKAAERESKYKTGKIISKN